MGVRSPTLKACYASHPSQTQAVNSALHLECVGAARRRHRTFTWYDINRIAIATVSWRVRHRSPDIQLRCQILIVLSKLPLTNISPEAVKANAVTIFP